ncbi:lyase family protein [Luethyella okanaganae]|uniref:Lyase family protein n=1 Tax=Luethyella okanaganae TaxID=69372 RepID=A0ABW1VGQ6_9MICO
MAETTGRPVDVGLLSPVSILVGDEASDRAFVDELIGAELALMLALVELGVAPASVSHAVAELLSMPPEVELWTLARDSVASGNPVIPLVPLLKAHVARVDPDAVDWVHVGATSQDIMDSALMTLARDAAASIVESLRRTAAALEVLARAHRDAPAAARTLTQHAVPTTLGLKAANWSSAIVRARRRVEEVADRLPAQLGGAGGTLASFVELFGQERAAALPAHFARELGLQAPDAPWHTNRWPVTELGDALVAAIAAVGTLAADVATLARTEVGEASVGAGGGSSAMPQKQNPVDAVLIRSAALRAPGLAAQLHLAAGLAVDERPDGAWHAEWPVLQELLRLALGASARAAELSADLTFDPERARANLDLTGGLIVSERLRIVLVPRIGKARFDVLIAEASAGGSLGALVRALPEASGLDTDDLMNPAHYVGLAQHLVDTALHSAVQEGMRP